MPRSATVSRDAFVRATAELLRRQGYAATGLNEIVERSGAPRGSLYFHFPQGKEQLALAAMTIAGEQLRRAIEAVVSSSTDLGEALARLVDVMAAELQRSGFEQGCPIATVTLEAATSSAAIRATADAVFESWLEVLAERLAGDGFGPEEARRRATLVLAAIEGGLILARARADVAPLVAVRDELIELAAR